MKDMNPGSDKAAKKGCVCPVLDNAHGKGCYKGGFIITKGCPLHDLTNEENV